MTDSELGRWVDNDGAREALRAQRDEIADLRAKLTQAHGEET